jgi:hypothetical protein
MTEALGIPVTDPFGVADDPAMPFLVQALDPLAMQRRFEDSLPSFTAGNKSCQIRAIHVVRHKPGRRCLIEYDVEVAGRAGAGEAHTLVGKVRAKGADDSTYHLLVSLRNAGFGADSRDGVRVPEPIGIISEFQMWLQYKAPGISATRLLTEPGGAGLARRIAEAIHKLHQTGIPSTRRHTMAHELRILHERLPLVARMKPQLTKRLERILAACDRLGATTSEPTHQGIHRDFYADHVIVDGPRLYLVDFDLYCEGDPGLDMGNFVAHLTEQSLRTLRDPTALRDREQALEERFVELAGEATRIAVRAYTILTLVRHIYLSTQFTERRPFTECLLQMCEQRLGIML